MLEEFYCEVAYVGSAIDAEDIVSLTMVDLVNQSNGDMIILELAQGEKDSSLLTVEVVSKGKPNFDCMTCEVFCSVRVGNEAWSAKLNVRYTFDGRELEYAVLSMPITRHSPLLPKIMQHLPYAENAIKPPKDRGPK